MLNVIDMIGPFGMILLIALPIIIWGCVISWRERRDKKEELAERPRRNYSLFASPKHRAARVQKGKRIEVTVTFNPVSNEQ